MAFLRDTLRTSVRDARAALSHAPLEVALGIALAIGLSVVIRADGDDEWYARQWVATLLAAPPLVALSALRVRGAISSAKRWGLSAAVLAATVTYAWLAVDPDRQASGMQAVALGVASLAVGVLLPALVGGGDTPEARRDVFWRWWTGLLVRSFVTAVYAGLLFAALAGAIAAVIGLFELETPDHLFQDIGGIVFFALAPWVVAGGLPALAAGDPPSATERLWMGRLGRFLWGLVMVLYLAILYAYAAKVVATQALPQNLLSPVVLFAAIFGLIGAALLEPLARDGARDETPFVATLVRIVPALLLPLLPLAAWAILERQAAYGWTEFRYLRMALIVALTILAAWGAYRLGRKQPPLARAVPAVVGIVALLSAFGPWGANSVSLRSQRARLAEAVDAVGERPLVLSVVDTLRDAPRRVIPYETYDVLEAVPRWLFEQHGPEALDGLVVLPPTVDNGWEIGRYLPFAPSPRRDAASCDVETPVYLHATGPYPNVPGGTLSSVTATVAAPTRRDTTATWVSGDTLYASTPAWRASASLQDLVRRARSGCEVTVARDRLDGASAVRPLVDASGVRRATFVIESMRVERARGVPAHPREVSGMLIEEAVPAAP